MIASSVEPVVSVTDEGRILTYRVALVEEIPEIQMLVEKMGLHWPGEAATPFVAVDDQGTVIGVCFAVLAWHLDTVAALPDSGFSISCVHDLMDARMREISAENDGAPIAYYTFVQNNEKGLAAASKNGMQPIVGVIPHVKLITSG